VLWALKWESEINGVVNGYAYLSEYTREGPGSGVNGDLHTDSLGNTLVESYPALGSDNRATLVDLYPDPHHITYPVY